MSFRHGFSELAPVQQAIAFWTHAIDMLCDQFWAHGTSMGVRAVTPMSEILSDVTGIQYENTYLGAVRAGFAHTIAGLPEEVRTPVERYLDDRLNGMRLILKKELLNCDVLFGNKDPTNFFYSGVRLREDVPLTSQEAVIQRELAHNISSSSETSKTSGS